MPDQVPEVFAVFRCAICQGNDPVWTSSNRSDHAFGSPGRLMCTGCGTAFKVRNGFLDLHPGDPEPIPPIQHLMQFPPIVAVYEALWLPFKAGSFDAVTCCGALQLFRDQDQAVSEIARVLKMQGDFVCQTTLGPRKPPLWIRMADRMLKFGYFYLDDLKERLYRFNFDLQAEERSNINYIFRAAKSG